MIIRSIKLRAATVEGEFGFKFDFGRNLTIIRAENSSGKSTLFNSLLYGLGMEELAGGKNEQVLPYAVKEYVEFEGRRIIITASEVLVEVENHSGEIITIRRAIRDANRGSKLIEVFESAHLTDDQLLGASRPTFIHDAGSAFRSEGFHHFLEGFLGLDLPQVPTSKGGETKLYMQTIFAALAVEQKRGWTDYIANIPYFGIKDASIRVAEFLLGLSVFETATIRNRLNSEALNIERQWRDLALQLRTEAYSLGMVVDGVPTSPAALFEKASASILRRTDGSSVSLAGYVTQLRAEYSDLNLKADHFLGSSGVDTVNDIERAMTELQELSVRHERASASFAATKLGLREFQALLAEAREDLERNKTAAKLRDLGAERGIDTADDRCPTCNQEVEDTLLALAVSGPQMDLATNISYLKSQQRMLQRQISGLEAGSKEKEMRVKHIASEIARKRDVLAAMRRDVTTGTLESKGIVRRQVQIEVEVEALERLQAAADKTFSRLVEIAKLWSDNQTDKRALPKDAYTADDASRIAQFQTNFRRNATNFGYKSAPVNDIVIDVETLVPSLAQMTLREFRTDIKSDSSASDFVRLIWSYLLALYQGSSRSAIKGNHIGLLMLDEPGQHSMAVESQHALLALLASESELQSIVAASFDESEDVFRNATRGVPHKLIEWDGKLLRPI